MKIFPCVIPDLARINVFSSESNARTYRLNGLIMESFSRLSLQRQEKGHIVSSFPYKELLNEVTASVYYCVVY